MNRLVSKRTNRLARKNRVRKIIKSHTDRPRLSVFISNRNISAQIIDDKKHITVVSVSTGSTKAAKSSMTEKAAILGKEIAKKAKVKKIKKVSFDRGSSLYHGRIKALAEAAREEGLEF